MELPGVSAKILVVDDEKDGRRLIKSILTQANYETKEAENGEEAVEKLRREKFDLLILDVQMPKMDGYQVCHEIRNDPLLKRIPVIMLTVMGDTLDRVRGHRLGIDDYITKPFDAEEFLARVDSVLSRRNVYEEMSMLDPLTKLYNLNYFKEQFESIFNLSRRNDNVFSLALIDIDKFKYINDTYGHLAGDYVLKHMAEIMTSTLRKTDIITRYGGDEFTIILPHLGPKQAKIALQKLEDAVEKETFTDQQSGETIDVTISWGISTFNKNYTDAAQMFEKADKNMYKDKSS